MDKLRVKDHVNSVERTKTYDKADRVTSATDSRGGKLTGHITTKQTVTQGGYTNKVSYDYNTLDETFV